MKIEVPIQKKKFSVMPDKIIVSIPGKIEELSEYQFLYLPEYLTGQMSRTQIVEVFSSLSKTTLSLLDNTGIDVILKALSFLYDAFNTTGISYFVPVRCNFLERAELNDVPFEAFVKGEELFKLFNEEKNFQYLVKFATCYYYSDGKFHGNHIDNFSRILEAHLELCKKTGSDQDQRIYTAISINYMMIRKWLKLQYPDIFRIVDETGSISWNDLLDPTCNFDHNIKSRALTPMLKVLLDLDKRVNQFHEIMGKGINKWEFLKSFDLEVN